MSIASQLQAIRSVLKGAPEPKIRPSVLFDPREASDIDLRTLLPIALSGLEVLIELDGRFRSYKDTLFSQTSLELDREKMVPKEEEKLNRSMCSYLRLLSGHLQLHAALKTLEYLIRRYLVHVYNLDALVLCALPFHDTNAFVRIVQLLDLGNSKWMFLEGVKASGAPPPRKVIVQQCLRDKGLLETLCNYASPTKEFQHPRPVICFCTAVVVETLGAIPNLDTDTVQRVLGFVFNGLNPTMRGNRDDKAGALMVVGLLATRATLASKLIQSLIFFIARMAQHDANLSVDLPWLRVIIMTLVTLVQSQSRQMLSKKTVMVLQEIRDFPGVLSGLYDEFNIWSFFRLYMESLVEYSMSEDSLLDTLNVVIEDFPSKNLVEIIVSKVLANCMKLSQRMDTSDLHEAGNWGKKILIVLNKYYPCELRGAIRKFLENCKMNLGDEEDIAQRFCLMFEGTLDMPIEISDSKLWFSLEHPKAVVRQATLSNIAASGILKTINADTQKLVNIQDAIMRALHDEDLSVVRAALSIDGLARITSPPYLLKAYHHVLSRCMDIIDKNIAKTLLACDIAMSCLERLVLEFQLQHLDYSKEVGQMIFPLLLVRPKTWRLNLKALELVNRVKWLLYVDNSIGRNPANFDQMKNPHSDHAASINSRTIRALAERFVANPQEDIQWLIQCSSYSGLSKSLFFFIIFQALIIINEDFGSPLKLYQACFLALKKEWHEIEPPEGFSPAEELNLDKFDKICVELVNQLFSADVEALNRNILICIFWSLLKSYNDATKHNKLEDGAENVNFLDELFLFFITSPSRKLLRNHLQFLVINCSRSPFEFLSKYFIEEGSSVEVQVGSLDLFGSICSRSALSERSNLEENSYLQLLLGFPSLLIPLASDDKDIRMSAMHCIEELYKLWCTFDVSRFKNGNDMILSQCLSSPTFQGFLESISNEKTLISSDVNFLPSYLTSMLSSSSNNLLTPDNSQNRLDPPAKDAILLFILHFALKCSSYGKLKMLSLLKGMGTLLLNVGGVKSLLFELMKRRNQYDNDLDKFHQKLSKNEIEILCLLLEICIPLSSSTCLDADIIDCLLRALRVDGLSPNDPAILEPCATVLQILTPAFFDNLKTELQVELFGNLVILFRNDNGDVRNASREALLRLNINCSTIVSFLELISVQCREIGSSKRIKRKKVPSHHTFALHQDAFCTEEARLSVLISLLDIVLQKKNIKERDSLAKPLFALLEKIFSDDWLIGLANQGEKEIVSLSEVPESVTSAVCQAQQMTLLILKDISDSLLSNLPLVDNVFSDVNMTLLVEIARSTNDVTTRNHVFMLLSSITKVSSVWISKHIIDIFAVIGESALKQNDSHSQHVLEDLISTMVPCWLSKTKSIDKLLQIFIRALPEVAEPRRLTLMVYLLRILGEESSIGILILHLFRSLVLRITKTPEVQRNLNDFFSCVTLREWEYTFATEICNLYSCKIWFPSLAMLFQLLEARSREEEFLLELHLIMQFTVHKLQDTELVFELKSGQDVGYLQMTLGELLQKVVLHLQLIRGIRKMHGITMDTIKELKDSANRILNAITSWMVPSTYFAGITQLLEHTDKNVKKQTLALLCQTVKNHSLIHKKRKEKKAMPGFPLVIDDIVKPSFNELCLKIVQLIDGKVDTSNTRVKLAAISSLEALSKEFPSDKSIFATCLTTIVKNICSDDLAISSGCIRTTGALIAVLGSKALPQLPQIMQNIIERSHEISKCLMVKFNHSHSEIFDGISDNKLSILLSVLTTLEVVVEKLGGFLNPYLKDILDLIVLHPEYALDVDSKIKMKADAVRKLLTVTIPVRLMLTPLLQIYSSALGRGESSLSWVFEMLANMVSSMDRASIGTYHVKIFEHCLIALDLRRQLPESIKNINMVELSVIDAMIVLTMKLTETMFRPLFLHSLEWAESQFEGSDSVETRSLDRTISFYNLVNKLIEHHRSLFVPYFKHLLEGCVRYLTATQFVNEPSAKKRKKAKVADAVSHGKDELLSLKQWHLRAVILKSLYKCFLYDTDLKLLDSTNFQILLKPIVLQLVIEPPKSLEQTSEVPKVEEVDELLVLCLGQMAITARSDVLWKPLNHEVLMQTRSEKMRPKTLGLKIVKYLVEHLKEEYLVFLPETIPFLGELLEDVDLPVKTLAQEILKEMEILSGESLRQYL